MGMRLEFCYKDYFIKLLSYPEGDMWRAQCQVWHSTAAADAVHMLKSREDQCFQTLEEANDLARDVARAWVDQKQART